MNGTELLTRLHNGGSAHVVVIITGHGDIPMAVAVMRAGAFHFAEKPFDPETFVSIVMEALARVETLGGTRTRKLGQSVCSKTTVALVVLVVAIGPRSINRFAATGGVVVWGVAIVFAANQVGIASELLTTVFTALVAGFAFAFAFGLAFGLGAHETVRDVLRKVNLPMRWPDALGKKSRRPAHRSHDHRDGDIETSWLEENKMHPLARLPGVLIAAAASIASL